MEDIKEYLTQMDEETVAQTESSDDKDSLKNKEKFSDVIITQLTLCVILLIIIVALNIIKPELSHSLVTRFKELTTGETEQVFKDAVVRIKEMVYDKIYTIRI